MELNWQQGNMPGDATMITTIDAHAAGEPFRIITGGLPTLPGTTILERRRYLQEHLDHVRRTLMWEPRGHRDMYGCVLTSPVTPEADLQRSPERLIHLKLSSRGIAAVLEPSRCIISSHRQ
jgi:proline racemase